MTTTLSLPLIIYHKNCADGFGAAWAAYKKFGADGAEYLPMGYNDPRIALINNELNFPASLTGRDIYILDFSFSPEVMDAMLTLANQVFWRDHHLTAFQAFNFVADRRHELTDTELNWNVVLDPNKSGCVLAWELFHPNTPTPLMLELIQDRDLWHWKLNGTRDFATALRSEPFTFKWFDRASNDVEAVCTVGAGMNKLFDQQITDITKKPTTTRLANEPEELNYLGLSVNCTPQFSSEAGHILAKASGTFGMTWHVGYDGMIYASLRSIDDYDVSAIAKQFGGGGHKNAAGFKTHFEKLSFEENNIITIRK
jgi:oligoribonuclease NrnB/cAMP/cGMP phosphodiesterase (DHH superfamily)